MTQLFTGNIADWQDHMLTAASLVRPLLQARIESSQYRPSSAGLGNIHVGRFSQDLSLGEDTWTKVVLGSIVSFDIIACASTRSQLLSGFDHKKVLEVFWIELENLFGCTSYIMTILYDIVSLDAWKKEAERLHKLSMSELVKRSVEIEERLHQQISKLKCAGEGSTSDLSTAQQEVSTIFALSALTYLHVVVSGANPHLPEIEESTAKTIFALQSLSDPSYLRHLVFPFCGEFLLTFVAVRASKSEVARLKRIGIYVLTLSSVAGCLASESQQHIFRELMTKANVTHLPNEGCHQAMSIMEECWEMRRTCYYMCDWVFIMNKRGRNSILM